MKLLSEALQEHPGFRPGWNRESPDIALTNSAYGTILHAVVCDGNGQPLYDQPLWLEGTGAICVDVDADERIGLVRHQRPALEFSSKDRSWPASAVNTQGVSLELPRGFPNRGESPADAAAREAAEETGYAVLRTTLLGYSNTNTTFYPNSNAVYLVQLDRNRPSSQGPDPNETIHGVEFHELPIVLSMIATGQIICGMTKSALLSYVAWRAK